MTTCNRSSACSCLHSSGYFSQIRGPAVSICSVVPPGIQLFLHPSPGHIGFFVLILVNHVHKWPPRIQASQGNMHIQIHPYPSLGIWQGSPTHLSASSATTPKSMFHPTATMIFITIKSVYIFPLLKYSYVTSRLSRKWKFLPSACKVLGTQPLPPLYLIFCHSSSLIHHMLHHTALLLPLRNTLLSLPAGSCTCCLHCMECLVASCYPYLISKTKY